MHYTEWLEFQISTLEKFYAEAIAAGSFTTALGARKLILDIKERVVSEEVRQAVQLLEDATTVVGEVVVE